MPRNIDGSAGAGQGACSQDIAAYLGRPACSASSASKMLAPGSFSLGFKTKVLPAVTAIGYIHRGTMAGKLKGQMPAHTCGGGGQ